MHPAIERVLKQFRYEHLPPHLQAVSKPIHDLAHKMVTELDAADPELTIGLRLLRQAKDCFVEVAVEKHGRPCNNDRPQAEYFKPQPGA